MGMVEGLEKRLLFSRAVFPDVLGDYSGAYEFSTGDTGTIQVHVNRQKGARFWGASSQSDGLTSSFHGSVNRQGNISFIVDTHPFGQRDNGVGSVSAGVFNVSEIVRLRGKIVAYGTLTATKA